MSKFTKEPAGLSSRAMSATERYASNQNTAQERAARALEELESRRIKQAQSLSQNQRKEARNQVKEYDFQSRMASNNYDPSRQSDFMSVRSAQDYMESNGYSSRMGSVQRIGDTTQYMEEAPYDAVYSRPHFSMYGDPQQDLNSILKEGMVNKIRQDVAKRAARARAERRTVDERYAENIDYLFSEDGGLGGLSPAMLNPRSIARGGYENETASPFGVLNQEQAMKRAAQVERMRENHRVAAERIQRDDEGGIHRLETDDKTRREWENMEAQRGYSIQEKYSQNSIFGGDVYGGKREVDGIIF